MKGMVAKNGQRIEVKNEGNEGWMGGVRGRVSGG